MRKHEILYDCIINQIQELADSEIAETYSSTLEEPALTQFTTLTEQMRGVGVDLARAKADRAHYDYWDQLQLHLKDYESKYIDFPGQSLRKLRVYALVAGKIAQIAEPIDTIIIDENMFELHQLTASLPLKWFSHENQTTFEDSVVVFSCSDIDALNASLDASNASPKIMYHLLASLLIIDVTSTGHIALVKKTNPSIELSAVESFVHLAILATGKPIHMPQRYKKTPTIIDQDQIQAGTLFQQWGDVLNVLSEYNSRDEILYKYLTIYHVIENLMFKHPIVQLERQNGGRMFSIRDFRQLYQQVDVAESDALKRLFTAVLKEEGSPGVTFEMHIVTRWQGLVPDISEDDIEKALGALGIKKNKRPLKHSEFTAGGECAGYLARMVYVIRCAIVHNKETELHLTYASLDDVFIKLLEEFFMPSLEELCFALISKPNQQVWYSQKELLLY